MFRWRVDFKGKRLQHVGTIKATTAEDAINEVVKLFRIEPMLRDKLVAIKCPEPLVAIATALVAVGTYRLLDLLGAVLVGGP